MYAHINSNFTIPYLQGLSLGLIELHSTLRKILKLASSNINFEAAYMELLDYEVDDDDDNILIFQIILFDFVNYSLYI
jgi:hypothetical protein